MPTRIAPGQTLPDLRAPFNVRIRNDFARRIREGELRPGEQLPGVRQVARDYGVGLRTAARAFQLLTEDGLIDTRQGLGAFVREGDPSRIKTDVFLCLHPAFLNRGHWLAFERLRGILEAASGRDAVLHPVNTDEEFLAAVKTAQRPAIILFDHNYGVDRLGGVVRYARETGAPCCVISGRNVPGSPLTVENHRADGFEALTVHLAELGHRRVAMLNYPASPANARQNMSHENRQGWLRGLKRAGLEPEPALYVEAPEPEEHSAAFTAAALDVLLAARSTAILCNNDSRALLVLKLLCERGLRVPQDISLAGCDNRPEGARTAPALSSIDTRLAEQGEKALLYVLDRAAGRDVPAPFVRPRLVLRASTAPPRVGTRAVVPVPRAESDGDLS